MSDTTPHAPDARIELQSVFMGKGAAVQALGLAVLVALWWWFGETGAILGLVAFVVLFLAGSRESRRPICGRCRNPLASGDVRICPVCRATLDKARDP